MIRLKLFTAFAFLLLPSVTFAQSIDPIYGFPFGFALGSQASFRNRLPTPPYFSIYPPVYYGERYKRPYGDSPYASFPLLGSTPEYSPAATYPSASMPSPMANPYAPECCGDDVSDEDSVPKLNIVASNRPPRMKIIVNPYAREILAAKD